MLACACVHAPCTARLCTASKGLLRLSHVVRPSRGHCTPVNTVRALACMSTARCHCATAALLVTQRTVPLRTATGAPWLGPLQAPPPRCARAAQCMAHLTSPHLAPRLLHAAPCKPTRCYTRCTCQARLRGGRRLQAAAVFARWTAPAPPPRGQAQCRRRWPSRCMLPAHAHVHRVFTNNYATSQAWCRNAMRGVGRHAVTRASCGTGMSVCPLHHRCHTNMPRGGAVLQEDVAERWPQGPHCYQAMPACATVGYCRMRAKCTIANGQGAQRACYSHVSIIRHIHVRKTGCTQESWCLTVCTTVLYQASLEKAFPSPAPLKVRPSSFEQSLFRAAPTRCRSLQAGLLAK